MGSQRTVTILAREEGEAHAKSPNYVECLEDGVILHPGEEFIAKEIILQSKSILDGFLNEISDNSEEEYLIMAVRPKGIETFYTVRELARDKKIDFGYEPVDEGWKLRFRD
jgi:hypothetical protein